MFAERVLRRPLWPHQVEAAQAGALVRGLADDDSAELALPFSFPFFGASYVGGFVNSDGNLTFGEADGSSSTRSLGRMSAGPPRVAPFFRDLDPSRPAAEVRVDVVTQGGQLIGRAAIRSRPAEP